MKCWFLVLVLVLFGTSSFAEEIRISDGPIEELLGKQWKGILYVCDPYCRFISIREEAQWNPVLNNESVDIKTIRGVAHTDPVYPFLIVKSPVYPFISQRLKNSELVKKEEDITSKAPLYAQAPFNYGWRLAGGFKVSQLSVNTDTSVQSELQPQGLAPGLSFEAALMKGTPNKIWKYWVQQALHISLDIGAAAETADGSALAFSGMDLRYQWWFPQREFKHGARLSMFKSGIKLSNENINHYSIDESLILFGWGLLWNRWEVALDTGLSGNIHDSQNFRQGPFEQRLYRLELSYCSKELSLFDIPFGLCGGAGYVMDSQSSKLAENVYVAEQSKVDLNSTSIKFLILIGEDFYR